LGGFGADGKPGTPARWTASSRHAKLARKFTPQPWKTMIETLTLSHFEPHVGEVFALAGSNAEIPLTLKSAKPLGTALRDGGAFALNFAGPAAPLLQQSIYPLRHAALGTLDLFIVPVGKDKDGIIYEAIFT
jgi:hypothetical protein